jgi:glycosyltransferase involved in cell wall biosynthesis
MAELGHEVHVFTATSKETYEYTDALNLKIHRIQWTDPVSFYTVVVDKFMEVESAVGFDIMECSEYLNEALLIKKLGVKVPLVVKLHTPMYLVSELNSEPLTFIKKVRYILGALRRFRLPDFPWIQSKESDTNYQVTKYASIIHSPSVSLKSIVHEKWEISPEKIKVVPYPYTINEELLKIPVETEFNNISFIGRIENRKGVFNFAKSLPLILDKYQTLKVRFIGSNTISPYGGKDSVSYIREVLLPDYLERIEFLKFEYKDISKAFASTDVCVFPSLWENFPNVCLEAMASGRGIIASNNGGMYDMLHDCEGGILIDPTNITAISSAIISMLDDKERRWKMGQEARRKLLNTYNSKVIGTRMQGEYLSLIRNADEQVILNAK